MWIYLRVPLQEFLHILYSIYLHTSRICPIWSIFFVHHHKTTGSKRDYIFIEFPAVLRLLHYHVGNKPWEERLSKLRVRYQSELGT